MTARLPAIAGQLLPFMTGQYTVRVRAGEVPIARPARAGRLPLVGAKRLFGTHFDGAVPLVDEDRTGSPRTRFGVVELHE